MTGVSAGKHMQMAQIKSEGMSSGLRGTGTAFGDSCESIVYLGGVLMEKELEESNLVSK